MINRYSKSSASTTFLICGAKLYLLIAHAHPTPDIKQQAVILTPRCFAANEAAMSKNPIFGLAEAILVFIPDFISFTTPQK